MCARAARGGGEARVATRPRRLLPSARECRKKGEAQCKIEDVFSTPVYAHTQRRDDWIHGAV